MKTASVFLRTAIIGAIIGNVFLARNIVKINKDPWLPLNDDANKRHDTNDKNKEDENKFSNRQSFSDDYDAEEYKDILKHLQLYRSDTFLISIYKLLSCFWNERLYDMLTS